jgi:hypothetical protein
MGHIDRSYFIRRATEELAAAESAASPAAARIHRELAQRYSAMSEQHPSAGAEVLLGRQSA